MFLLLAPLPPSLLRPHAPQQPPQQPPLAPPAQQVRLPKAARASGQGLELSVPEDEARQRGISQQELVQEAHVSGDFEQLGGGLEGVGSFLP